MITVLQSSTEAKNAKKWLNEHELVAHPDLLKNWDYVNLCRLARAIPAGSSIVDFGCGPSRYGCTTLELFYLLGFDYLLGIDLHVPFYAHLGQRIRAVQRGVWNFPYRMQSGSLLNSKVPSASANLVILLSAIEHGVPIKPLFQEVERILQPGGFVYISTDYWPTPISTKETASGAFGSKALEWRIYTTESILQLLELAEKSNLYLVKPGSIPRVKRPVIQWKGCRYTFLSLTLRKKG
ncbi:MAG: class I SAM-dependent methyltransferase [Candidatus Heimdallarchaeota archaeon]